MNNTPQQIDFERTLKDEGRQRKHIMLYVAVAVSTAFVVAAWLLLLPKQLQEMRVLSPEENARWGEVQGGLKESEKDFNQNLTDLREQMDQANGVGAGERGSGEGDAEIQPSRATDDTKMFVSGGAIDALRARIEELEKESTTPDIEPDNHATKDQ